MGWKVDYELPVKAEIKALLDKKLLTHGDLRILVKWVSEIENHGLEQVQTKYWNDHPLSGEWMGCRSASFSLRGRIIYRIEQRRLVVMVIRITATHNYRR